MAGIPGERIDPFAVGELVSPVLKIVLSVLSGVMGPIIFLSLVTAINTLDDVELAGPNGFGVPGTSGLM